MRLKDKVTIVTGGSRGIGRAIAETFAREGAKVAIVYNQNRQAADAVVAAIAASGGAAIAVQQDVAAPDGADVIVGKVVEDWGRLDILVNNAGIIRDGLFLQISPEDWNAVIQTNLTGGFLFCKAAGQQMMRQRSGAIVNMSSVAAQHSNKGQCNYAASKAGIEALTRTLAVELAGRKVRVNAIAPGFIETDMTEAVRGMAGDKIVAMIPMKRYGAPADVANVALFLASDESAYITGQVFTVDGGLSLGAHA